MSKIVLIEKKIDPLLQAAGKAKIVDTSGFQNSRLINNPLSTLKVTFLEKVIKDDGILYSEVTKLRIDPAGSDSDFRSVVSATVPLGDEFTNHFASLDKTDPLSAIQASDLNQSIATYDITTRFNYVSADYDVLQKTVSTTSLPWIGSRKEKGSFLNFKRERISSPLDYSSKAIQFENLVVPNAGPVIRKDLNSSVLLEQFPYYNEIKITNKVSNKFMNFITKVSLFDSILAAYSKSRKIPLDFNIQDGQSVGGGKIGVFDLLSWVNSAEFSFPNNLFPLDPASIKNSAMINNYKKLLFAGYVRNLSKGSFRSFEEIYNNIHCYKEDYVYSIDKYEDVEVGPSAQTIYIPAIDDTSLFNDTQIKYGKKYIYKCKGLYIIVGNKYSYSNLKYFEFQDDKDYATVEVTNTPSVMIVPVDMFTKSVMTLMPPPIFPQVKFVTQNNSNNHIQVFLSPTKGERREPFIQITPSDADQAAKMELNSISEGKKIKFQFTPQSGLYEVFKTDLPPKDYNDFSDKKLAEKRMSFSTNSAIFNDFVTPNKKYYYLFRKVNVKGLVSNPTSIYEVELLKDADDSKIVVEEYNFPKKITDISYRRFKSLFQIHPAGQQTWFDQEQDILFNKSTLKGTIDNLALGVADKSVWGRKFKLRIKSTTSGKIIDYNITFKLTKNKTQEDF